MLHLSPPCQFFSPAHTRDAAHDDENIFALFGCSTLIDTVRPRLATVEQTFGITWDKHSEYYHALVGMFTQFGYSVRWKVVKLKDWGLAQDRKRLIMIAAAPGEVLPTFPPSTHGPNLKSYNTIGKALSMVKQRDPLHNLTTVKWHQPPRRPFDADRLADTITTGGSTSYHPSGERNYTIREYACLQGFPNCHRFLGTKTQIIKQIGNAFAPNTVEVLYRHLMKSLLDSDGISDRGVDVEVVNLEPDVMIVDDDSLYGATAVGSGNEYVDLEMPRGNQATMIDLT